MRYPIILIIISVFACSDSSTSNATIHKSSVNASKLKVVIEQADNVSSFDATGHNKIIGIMADVLVFNASEDTVKFAYSDCMDTAFFTTNSSNLILNRIGYSCKSQNVGMTIFKPHQYIWVRLDLVYRKVPKQVFKFKVGFHILNWNNYHKNTSGDVAEIKHADVIWSDDEILNPNGNQFSGTKPTRDYKKLAEILSPPLNSLQQGKLSLRIDKDHLIKRKKSKYSDKGKKSFVVPVKLFNNSNDTLEYANMSCDWPLIFITSDRLVNIESVGDCLGNYPTNYRLAPHKGNTFNMLLDFDSDIKPGTHFKVEMILLDFKDMIDGVSRNFPEYLRAVRDDAKYTIWSDEVEVPLSK